MRTQYSSSPDSRPRIASDRRRRRQGGNILIMFTMMLPFVLIPIVGLAIDATMLYTVKAKLQAAVDGGAIAAAQALSSGLTFSVQQAAAQKSADEFLKANIAAGATPGSGFFGAYGMNDTTCDANGQPDTAGGSPCIVAAQNLNTKVTTVTISASVQVPLLFMRILGFSAGTVASSGQASRRTVVLVMVIDRSSSMNHVIAGVPVMTTLQQAATWFVQQFQEGRDQLGLVTFGGSAIVAYPSTDWDNTAPHGPDSSFMYEPDSAAVPNMITSINNIAISTNTGTAEGLIDAWKEIQAANQPGALNVIVLFTDGQPNGITANFNSSTGVGNGTGTTVISNAHCSYPSVAPNASLPKTLGTSMFGWMAQWGGYVAGTNGGNGIFSLAQWNNTAYTSVTAWLQSTSGEPVLQSGNNQPAHNCSYASGTGNLSNDLTRLPGNDYYGDSTTGVNSGLYTTNDYQQAEIWNDTGECKNGSRVAQTLMTHLGDSCQIGLASWNAADQAARQIHNDLTYTPVIYAMGFEGNGGDDPAFMGRLANLTTSTVYNPNIPTGMYIQVQTPADIEPAFQSVLAEILRLSN